MSAASFDAAGFVADLVAAGLMVGVVRDVPRGGEKAEPPSYFIRSVEGQGLGSASGYDAVMARWRPAMVACLDYGDRIIEHLSAPPKTFDPAAFVADLQAAGCRVILSWPATTFGPDEEPASYFVKPSPAYAAVMAKWSDAMGACPDAHERVVACLFEMREAEA